MNNTLELDNITPEHFANIQKNVGNQLGQLITGNQGEAEKFQIGISWNYDPSSQKLILTNTKKPFFIGQDEILSKLKEACA